MTGIEEYKKLRQAFSLSVPDTFSFPLDVFDRHLPSSLCLFWTDGIKEVKLTFGEMKELSSKGAGFLKTRGITAKDKVLVMQAGIPEWWEVMLSLMRINAIPIPATTLLTAKDILYRLKAVDIKAVITDEENIQKFKEASENIEHPPILITTDEYVRERASESPFVGERASSDSPALIFFTSGTTGLPKMVLHTQASYPFAHRITGRFWLDLKADDLHFNLSDTGWAKAAWSSLFGPWHMGACVFSFFRYGRFDPQATIEVLEKYSVTTFCGPPTAYRMMVKEWQGKIELKGLRHCVGAGEPLNKEVIELWREKTGLYIYDGYGQTETVNVLANLRCLWRAGSMGVPTPGFDVDVVDETGLPVTTGAEGDIAIRVKPVRPVGLFREYLGNPKATGETIKGDFYITGDRAYKDEDGFFWFIGRADDVILTSGYRIGPFEIESVLIEHPAVEESAITASPDPLRGEVVKAFIVLTKGYEPSEYLVKELQDFVKNHTAPYKYPRKIAFVKELPKTVSGKIKRKELKLKEFSP